jgi:uncharacterized Tic20 family protein
MNEAANSAELPSQDERTMAILAHVLQLVGSFVAPLVILLTKRESRFVSFHALQALLLQIAYVALMFVFFVLWFGLFFMTMAHHPPVKDAPPPPMFFVMFPLVWLGFMGTWVVMLVVAIVYGIKAGRGEWAPYPLLGALAPSY